MPASARAVGTDTDIAAAAAATAAELPQVIIARRPVEVRGLCSDLPAASILLPPGTRRRSRQSRRQSHHSTVSKASLAAGAEHTLASIPFQNLTWVSDVLWTLLHRSPRNPIRLAVRTLRRKHPHRMTGMPMPPPTPAGRLRVVAPLLHPAVLAPAFCTWESSRSMTGDARAVWRAPSVHCAVPRALCSEQTLVPEGDFGIRYPGEPGVEGQHDESGEGGDDGMGMYVVYTCESLTGIVFIVSAGKGTCDSTCS